MGLTGIHHPDALSHFTGVTFCPWCRKEGLNRGTMVNHLPTMHYKLGLVCDKCLHFPTVTSEAIMAKAANSPRKVTPERRMGAPMMCLHQTNQQPPPLPPVKILSAQVAATQVLQDKHTAEHSYLSKIHVILHCYIYHSLQMHLLFVIKIILKCWTAVHVQFHVPHKTK